VNTPQAIQLDPHDNVLVALADLPAGESVLHHGITYTLPGPVPAKHKFSMQAFEVGDEVRMYGVTVGRARQPIPLGGLLSTANLAHDAAAFHTKESAYHWTAPNTSAFRDRTFLGYHRADGQVGTRNYWLVIPLVFCENRNVDALREAFEEELGYGRPKRYRRIRPHPNRCRSVAQPTTHFRHGDLNRHQ